MPVDHPITSTSGIYIITCLPTGKFYVGSAVNIKIRWYEHRKRLKRGDHHSRHLQNAWNKYGREAFDWQVLEEVEPANLIEREQHYLDLLGPTVSGRGFNIHPNARSRLGTKASEETKAKMSIIARNRSPEHRAKLAIANRHRSPEARARIGAAARRPKNLERLANNSHSMSPESRAKRAAALRGRKLSKEHRAKLSEARQGKKFTAERCAKMSEVRRGKKFTAEHRAKLSEVRRGKPKARKHRPLPGQTEFDF